VNYFPLLGKGPPPQAAAVGAVDGQNLPTKSLGQTVLSLYLGLYALGASVWRTEQCDRKEQWKESIMGDMPEGVIHTEVKADLFKSMGHPARILVLEMLVSGPVTVSSLRDGTGLEASNLSQHLGILRRQRLIVPSRKDGRLFYELTSPGVREVLDAARGLLGTILDGGLRHPAASTAAAPGAEQDPALAPAAHAG